MTVLRLYTGITPNTQRTLHYFFRYPATYLNAIASHVLKAINLDNYRVNYNVVKIALDEDNILTEQNYNEVSYISVADAEKNYYKFYYVESAVIQSGYVIFNVSVDLWASNIYNALFKNIIVNKSNLDFNNGIADNILHTGTPAIEEFAEYSDHIRSYYVLGSNRIRIAVLLQYNVSQATFGSNKITKTGIFVTDKLSVLNSLLGSGLDSIYDKYNDFELAITAVGTIYELASGLIGLSGNDAQVLKAWVIDDEIINFASDTVVGVTAHAHYGDKAVNLPLYQLPSQYKKYTVLGVNLNYNRLYSYGNFQNGMQLFNKKIANGRLPVTLHHIVDDYEIKIIAQQGERYKDITNMYELRLTTNGFEKTQLRQCAEALSKSIGMYKGGVADYAYGGPAMVGMGALNRFMEMIPQQPSYENAVGGGDAYNTFALPYTASGSANAFQHYVKSPYVYTYSESIIDEETKAFKYGLNYCKYFNTITEIFNYSLLDANYEAFLQMQCGVEGVSFDAKEIIEQHFANGLFITQLNE